MNRDNARTNKGRKEFKINIIEINTLKVKEIDLEKESVLIILNTITDIIMTDTMIMNIMINTTRVTNQLKYVTQNIMTIKNDHMIDTKTIQINHMINKTLMNNSMK